MALTGRLGLLAVLAAVLVGLVLPTGWGVLLTTTVLLALVAVDVALAGTVRGLQLSRSGDPQVRLGETVGDGELEVLSGLAAGETVSLDPVKTGIEMKQAR